MALKGPYFDSQQHCECFMVDSDNISNKQKTEGFLFIYFININ